MNPTSAMPSAATGFAAKNVRAMPSALTPAIIEGSAKPRPATAAVIPANPPARAPLHAIVLLVVAERLLNLLTKSESLLRMFVKAGSKASPSATRASKIASLKFSIEFCAPPVTFGSFSKPSVRVSINCSVVIFIS